MQGASERDDAARRGRVTGQCILAASHGGHGVGARRPRRVDCARGRGCPTLCCFERGEYVARCAPTACSHLNAVPEPFQLEPSPFDLKRLRVALQRQPVTMQHAHAAYNAPHAARALRCAGRRRESVITAADSTDG